MRCAVLRNPFSRRERFSSVPSTKSNRWLKTGRKIEKRFVDSVFPIRYQFDIINITSVRRKYVDHYKGMGNALLEMEACMIVNNHEQELLYKPSSKFLMGFGEAFFKKLPNVPLSRRTHVKYR